MQLLDMSGYQVPLSYAKVLTNYILQVSVQMGNHEYFDQVSVEYHRVVVNRLSKVKVGILDVLVYLFELEVFDV